MPIELRLPNINGMTEKEQLTQIRSYLYQFIPQLQWALNNMSSSSANVVTPTKPQVVSSTAAPLPITTFNAIKDLIITSGDIISVYYDKISELLEGEYSALSEFGEFVETTTQEIEKTSTSMTQAFSHIQTITTEAIDGLRGEVDAVTGNIDSVVVDIDGVKTDIAAKNSAINDELSALNTWQRETKAHIRTGLLDTKNGTPIFGVEIGQIDVESGAVVSRFARFTADRLEFYSDLDDPVAYISGYKLYITNAEILEELKVGEFVFDTSNGLALRWEAVADGGNTNTASL